MGHFKFTEQVKRRAYVTCDVLNTVRVEVLLAFPAVLFEVNLENSIHIRGQASHTVALTCYAIQIMLILATNTEQQGYFCRPTRK